MGGEVIVTVRYKKNLDRVNDDTIEAMLITNERRRL